MSDLFRQSAPAPGRYSRKVFYGLAVGVLLYSGFHSAIETLNNETAASIARVDIRQEDQERFGEQQTPHETRPVATSGSQSPVHHNLISVPAFRHAPRG